MGLQWDDVDFKARMIHIRHNAVLTEHETTVNDFLKTAAGRRDVPLSEELEQWLKAQKKLAHSKYAIAMENHKPISCGTRTLPDSLRRGWMSKRFSTLRGTALWI